MENDNRYVRQSEFNITVGSILMFMGWGFYSINRLFFYICASIGVFAMFYGLHLKDKEDKNR